MGKYIKLINDYLVKYQNDLGDLTTYNENNRVLEFIDGEYKLRFCVGWLRSSNEPDLLEIHMTLYNTTIPVKRSNIVKQAWVYRNKWNPNKWDVQCY